MGIHSGRDGTQTSILAGTSPSRTLYNVERCVAGDSPGRIRPVQQGNSRSRCRTWKPAPGCGCRTMAGFQSVAACTRVPQLGNGVDGIRPETREAVLQSGQDQPGPVPVLEVGGMHRHGQQQTLGIHLDRRTGRVSSGCASSLGPA